MAIDSKNVMSTLRKMSDAQLQQYAAMHKTDPYLFPLAFQESQTRKQLRAEEQVAQAVPQGKVNDQNLAQMMPEDVGIGALPAQNLEGMAAGGIVAFDEGGEVPRFQNTGLVRYPGLMGYEGRGGTWLPERTGYEGMSLGDFLSAATADVKHAIGWPGAKRRLTPLEESAANMAEVNKGSTFVPSSTPAPKFADPRILGAIPAADMVRSLPGANKDDADKGGADKYAPTYPGSTGMRPGGGLGLTALPGLTTTATGTAQDLQAMREQLGQPTIPQAQLDAIEKYRSAKESAAKEDLKELQADIEKQGPGMEGAEARAQARGEKLTKREGDLVGQSIFEAGMAIMAGESPYALTNIGKGAGIGMRSYTAGLDKLQDARDKLDESFDKIEQFRMNRADMNAKEIRAAKKDIRATRTEADRLGLEALMKEGEMNRADARSAFQVLASNRADMYKVAANYDLGIQQIAAQRDIAGQRNALMQDLYGGEAKARRDFGQIQTKVMGELSKDINYQMATPAAKAVMERDRLAREIGNNPFLAPYMAGIGFQKAPPPGGKVFELPGASD